MDELRLRKHVAQLLRVVLNWEHPSTLPPEIARIRAQILREAEDPKTDDATLKQMAKNLVQDIMAEAGTGDPEPTPQRPPQQPPQQYPGAQPTEDPYLEP